MNVVASNPLRPGWLIGRSVVTGLMIGTVGAIMLTIDGTVRQPNYVPASFLITLTWIFPYLLLGGWVIGALLGLISGALAIPFSRLRRGRIPYVLVLVFGVAIAIAFVIHPTQWATHAPTNILVLVLSAAIVILAAQRTFPR